MESSARGYLKSLEALPLSVNPFAQFIERINKIHYPMTYSYVFILLIVFGSIYLAILIISVTLVLVIFRRKSNQRPFLLLWQKKYLPYASQKVAYIVPNGNLSIIFSQILSSIIFEIYIVSSYRTLMSPNEIRAPYRNFWLSISYAPGFFGFWWSGFSALYVCLLSPNRSISQSSKKHPYVPHPLAMNFACLGTPVLVSLMSIAWGVVSVVRYNNREEAHKSLYTILEGLSGSWESQKVVPGSLNSTIEGLERPLQRVMDSNEAFLSQFKWASFSWFIVAIMAVGFYSTTFWLFLKLFRNSINFSSNAVLSASKIENGPSAHSVEQPALFPSVNSNDRTGTEPWRDDFLPKRKNPMSQKLQESYYFLTWHCGLLSLTLTWYCIVGVIFFAKARELAINPVWRSVAAWIVVSSSTILSLALLLQGRRILEGEVVVDELKNSPAHGVRITTSSAIQQAFEPDIVTFDAHKTKQSHLSVSVHAAQLMQLKFNEPKEQILPHLL